MDGPERFRELLSSIAEPLEYAHTLVAIKAGCKTSKEVAELRKIGLKNAAASLYRCLRRGLLTRSASRPFEYALTKQGDRRLEWLAKPKALADRRKRFQDGGKLQYDQFVRLIYQGCKTTADIANTLAIQLKHAAASASRVWKMGLLQRHRVGRQYLYSVTEKGKRLVEGTANFPGDMEQYESDGYTQLERGATASGDHVVLMAKYEVDVGSDFEQRMEFEIRPILEGELEHIRIQSKPIFSKGIVRVDPPRLEPGGYCWRVRSLRRGRDGQWLKFTEAIASYSSPDFVIAAHA